MKKPKDGKFPSVNPNEIPLLKGFVLNRIQDASGTSGTGIVAIGVMFPSGHCVMEWTTVVRSVGFYNSIADIEAIHGHGGMTRVAWSVDIGAST